VDRRRRHNALGAVDALPGHSPGSAIVLVEGGGRGLALVGDLAHHPVDK
jgi:glyoxylase-like metal-dependent hydrolase (beta-lactamase superfamily II)